MSGTTMATSQTRCADAPAYACTVRTLLTWVLISIYDGRAIPTSFFDGCDDWQFPRRVDGGRRCSKPDSW